MDAPSPDLGPRRPGSCWGHVKVVILGESEQPVRRRRSEVGIAENIRRLHGRAFLAHLQAPIMPLQLMHLDTCFPVALPASEASAKAPAERSPCKHGLLGSWSERCPTKIFQWEPSRLEGLRDITDDAPNLVVGLVFH